LAKEEVGEDCLLLPETDIGMYNRPVAKSLWISILALILLGCGPSTEQTQPQKLDPKDQQTSLSQNAEKKAVSAEEIKSLVDLEEYPGAESVENWRLVSDSLSPDEARFELVRRSADAPAKVVKFYETKLGEKASGQVGHQEIFGRTPRGNFVRVHVDGEGSGSKYTVNVISYAK
jgi:hypothetical protein